MSKFEELLDVMARLRSVNGCPWDREQTRESLKKYLMEESYEVLEALDKDDPAEIKEELGDLLFQIVFQCQIAEERGEFSVEDVIAKIISKMVGRHPHVFADAEFETAQEVIKQWEERKREEGKNRESILEGVPKELPALLKAHRIQSRAARVGFDWERIDDVMVKLDEEIAEFKKAIQNEAPENIEEEFGDLFFTLVNISRFVGVDPEDALRKTIRKFMARFHYIEMKASSRGKRLSDMAIEELDAFWEEAKGSQ
ncbi:MAG: nucleoside triphosphate pyrophosphohydrolase [Dissulfurispiraceae bacterium]